MVWTMQQELPGTLSTVIKETLRPELLAILGETLTQNDKRAQDVYSEISAINRQLCELNSPQSMQQHIQSSLRCVNRRIGQKAMHVSGESSSSYEETAESIDLKLNQIGVAPTTRMRRERLIEL
jgi:hypothetical protein